MKALPWGDFGENKLLAESSFKLVDRQLLCRWTNWLPFPLLECIAGLNRGDVEGPDGSGCNPMDALSVEHLNLSLVCLEGTWAPAEEAASLLISRLTLCAALRCGSAMRAIDALSTELLRPARVCFAQTWASAKAVDPLLVSHLLLWAPLCWRSGRRAMDALSLELLRLAWVCFVGTWEVAALMISRLLLGEWRRSGRSATETFSKELLRLAARIVGTWLVASLLISRLLLGELWRSGCIPMNALSMVLLRLARVCWGGTWVPAEVIASLLTTCLLVGTERRLRQAMEALSMDLLWLAGVCLVGNLVVGPLPMSHLLGSELWWRSICKPMNALSIVLLRLARVCWAGTWAPTEVPASFLASFLLVGTELRLRSGRSAMEALSMELLLLAGVCLIGTWVVASLLVSRPLLWAEPWWQSDCNPMNALSMVLLRRARVCSTGPWAPTKVIETLLASCLLVGVREALGSGISWWFFRGALVGLRWGIVDCDDAQEVFKRGLSDDSFLSLHDVTFTETALPLSLCFSVDGYVAGWTCPCILLLFCSNAFALIIFLCSASWSAMRWSCAFLSWLERSYLPVPVPTTDLCGSGLALPSITAYKSTQLNSSLSFCTLSHMMMLDLLMIRELCTPCPFVYRDVLCHVTEK